jgi:hypothetical protein
VVEEVEEEEEELMVGIRKKCHWLCYHVNVAQGKNASWRSSIIYSENYNIMSYNQGGDNHACHQGTQLYNHGKSGVQQGK